eukprot:49681-Rhodomonas_salina.1
MPAGNRSLLITTPTPHHDGCLVPLRERTLTTYTDCTRSSASASGSEFRYQGRHQSSLRSDRSAGGSSETDECNSLAHTQARHNFAALKASVSNAEPHQPVCLDEPVIMLARVGAAHWQAQHCQGSSRHDSFKQKLAAHRQQPLRQDGRREVWSGLV